MLTGVTTPPIDYTRAIAELVDKMPVERAAQVYDFACFLQSQSARIEPGGQDGDDWLNDTEEQMRAEDALWDEAYARHHNEFAALAEAARAEIRTNMTQPMFDEHGELAVDELIHHS